MTFLQTTAALILTRCDMLLESMGTEKSLEKFPMLSSLVSMVSSRDMEEWAEVESGLSGKSLSGDPANYSKLLSFLNGDRVLRSLLDLCIAVFCYPEADAYFNHHFGYGSCLHLAFLLEGIDFPDEKEVIAKAEQAAGIFAFDGKAAPLQYAGMSIDEKVMGFLTGSSSLSPLLSDFSYIYRAGQEGNAEATVNVSLIEEGAGFFEDGGKALQLSGKGGRRFIAKQIADKEKQDFLFINISDFLHEAGKERLGEYRDCLIREALLDNAGVCFYGITSGFLEGGRRQGEQDTLRRDLELLERMLFIPLIKNNIPLILCSDSQRPLLKSLEASEYRNLRLPEAYDIDERKSLWESVLKGYETDFDPYELALRYRLNASETAYVIKSFIETRDKAHSGDNEEELLNRICTEVLTDGEEAELGRIIFPDVRLDDVKVKKSVREVLDDVVTSVKSSAEIMDRWKLEKSYPYGRSMSLLISGPPGTGKTMTANAIAGELKLALYQVNISNIVDKYIGETEKHLEKVFSYAEKSNAVLFFDEADALFGARSEVHDSKDRYANTEISYLLQRIEAYDGIVIMATNIKGNIDPAFMRRIRYVVHFENPDEDMRREIWSACLNEHIPHEEIDFDYLAAQFDDFTGSTIKTVFLNACARAAGEAEKLSMRHLIYAVKHELEKGSIVGFSMDSLGKYGYLL